MADKFNIPDEGQSYQEMENNKLNIEGDRLAGDFKVKSNQFIVGKLPEAWDYQENARDHEEGLNRRKAQHEQDRH